jgi:hypothetical protein
MKLVSVIERLSSANSDRIRPGRRARDGSL